MKKVALVTGITGQDGSYLKVNFKQLVQMMVDAEMEKHKKMISE